MIHWYYLRYYRGVYRNTKAAFDGFFGTHRDKEYLSRLANKLFKIFTNFPLSDCTTGIKMMRKNIWNNINLESNPVGWAFAFEITIKAYLNNYKISEVPLKSVDRLFGGKSTFKPISWVKEYSKWFLWGIKKIKKRKPK